MNSDADKRSHINSHKCAQAGLKLDLSSVIDLLKQNCLNNVTMGHFGQSLHRHSELKRSLLAPSHLINTNNILWEWSPVYLPYSLFCMPWHAWMNPCPNTAAGREPFAILLELPLRMFSSKHTHSIDIITNRLPGIAAVLRTFSQTQMLGETECILWMNIHAGSLQVQDSHVRISQGANSSTHGQG